MTEEFTSIAFYLGVIVYSAASTVFFIELTRTDRPQATRPLGHYGPRLLALGAVIHAVHMVAASVVSHVCPVESLHFGLSLSALGAVVAYLVLRQRLRLHAMGAIVAPVALTFLIGAQFVSAAGRGAGAELPRGLLAFHIAANLLGVGVFLVAGGSSALYVMLERRLRSKRVSSLAAKLPPLDALDRAAHRLLLVGFPLLTFGVATGALFTHRVGDGASLISLRTLLGYATWALLATVLLLRQLSGMRGRRAAYGTLAGVACVLLVMLVYAVRGGAQT